jgi:hypothetical protein
MLRLTFALLVVCVCTPVGCADKVAGKPSPAAVAVASQDDALQQAKDADLPALKTADRAEVAESPEPIGTGKSVEITDATRIRRLVDALKPTKAPPSGGMVAVTIRFYQGHTLLREVWVYGDGEWGFRRPGTSWTTGRSDDLIGSVRQELAGDRTAR